MVEHMTKQKIIDNILLSLPEKYDYIIAAIKEANDTTNLSVEELMGSLRAHEQRK